MSTPTGRRKAVEQWPLTVTAVQDVSDTVRRITFTASQLGSYVRAGWDEYFGLLVPRADPTERPALRWYTMRALRPERAEMDVDIVVHGDDGPGTAWACRTEPGDSIDMRVGGAEYLRLPADGETHLVVADETSLPAVAALHDGWVAAGSPGQIVATVETPGMAEWADFAPLFHVKHLQRGSARPGSLVIDQVRESSLPELSYAWLCGESRMATTLRRHVITDRGVNRQAVSFSGYWRFT